MNSEKGLKRLQDLDEAGKPLKLRKCETAGDTTMLSAEPSVQARREQSSF